MAAELVLESVPGSAMLLVPLLVALLVPLSALRLVPLWVSPVGCHRSMHQ